ncbi:uncharacterized protein LOC123557927 [Mercenaria mercenaria]|uniref:uncharacterized protein LOC123557927 n=1 Tax=Mercenaria mercenaria TaxID=6596 RepID=UPI00234FB032|nr:uncharacterized protein LOC123557927 [Mercenaria mercenaria]
MANVAVTPQSSNNGTSFEQQHVQHVYEEIAASMNDIQHKAWPNVKRFLKKFPPGSLIADVGCGNGRYLNINKSTYKVGVDVCSGLVNNARTKGYEVGYADNLNLPFRDGTLDGVVSIGVIHHFCSVERRIKALRELARVLRPGGKLMLYVWAFEQKHRKFDSQDVLIPWRGSSKIRPVRTGSSSSFGMSSTSSISEDESVVQSTEASEQQSSQNSQQALRRQSSLSADDVTALLELNEFKPNYYSLDFSVSPQHTNKEGSDSEQIYVWNKGGLRKEHSKTKTNKIISECRKFEASLRAMSSGSLDLMESKCKDEQSVMRIKETKQGIKNDGIENVNCTASDIDLTGTESMNGIVDEKELGIALDWNVGDLETDDFETEIPNPCTICDTDFNENGLNGEKIENNGQNIVGTENDTKLLHSTTNIRRQNHFERTYHPKVNPFMKQDSLDPYTFNNVLCRDSNINIDKGSAEVVSTIQEDSQDVCVEFKPCLQSKGAQKKERSFFNAVKSKLLEIFDDKDEKTRKKKNSVPEKLNIATNHVRHPESLLSSEQLDLASKLNFKVREFPLSSCLDVVKEDKISPRGNLLSDSGIDLDNDNSTLVTGARNQLKENRLSGTRETTSLEGKLFTEMCNEISRDRCHSESALLNGIYDGYIKIDIDRLYENGDIGLNDFHGSALQKNIGDVKQEHDGEISDHDFDGDVNNLQKESLVVTQKLSTEKYSLTKQHSENCITSSENGRLQENCKELIEDSLSNRESLPSERTCRIGESSREVCAEQNGSTVAEVKDDSVFDLEDEEMSSKLCRYYHVFRKGEIETLISKHIPDLHIVQCFYDHANWCIITEKL